MITRHVTGAIAEMNKCSHTQKIQEASRRLKGIAMRRYLDKEQSPQCPIEMAEMKDHFRKIWAWPDHEFVEAEENSIFHLEVKIKEREEEMETFMLDDKTMEEVIKSRDDLSASGVDGISYQIMKGAGTAGVKFIRLLV
jgi:hypothetical protein